MLQKRSKPVPILVFTRELNRTNFHQAVTEAIAQEETLRPKTFPGRGAVLGAVGFLANIVNVINAPFQNAVMVYFGYIQVCQRVFSRNRQIRQLCFFCLKENKGFKALSQTKLSFV